MDGRLIKRMQKIMEEEQAYLDGNSQVQKDIYTKKIGLKLTVSCFCGKESWLR